MDYLRPRTAAQPPPRTPREIRPLPIGTNGLAPDRCREEPERTVVSLRLKSVQECQSGGQQAAGMLQQLLKRWKK
jgi:hypothetical protein